MLASDAGGVAQVQRSAGIRILMVSQHYAPEIGAAATRATELTQLWGAMGADVMVLTGMPSYPRPTLYSNHGLVGAVGSLGGVQVFRVPGARGIVGATGSRLRSYLGFVTNAVRTVPRLTQSAEFRTPDVVVATSGPPPVAGLGAYIARKLGVPLVLEYRDLTYLQMAATNRGGLLLRSLMQEYEYGLARMAHHVVVVTQGFKRILVDHGLDPSRITVIPNGVSLGGGVGDDYAAFGTDSTLLEIVQAKKPAFAYFGTLGLSQDLGEIVPVFGQSTRAGLLIVGDGADSARVRAIAAQYPEAVTVHEAVPEQTISPLYSMIRFHIVKLRFKEEFSATLPSKLFRIAGNGGLPLFIGPEGDAADFVKRIDNRLVCHSVDKLGECIDKLLQIEPEEIEQLRKKARDLVARDYNRQTQAEAYLDLVRNVVGRSC